MDKTREKLIEILLRDDSNMSIDNAMLDELESLVKKAEVRVAKHIKEICPVTDGASAERLHHRIDRYLEELQESEGEGK